MFTRVYICLGTLYAGYAHHEAAAAAQDEHERPTSLPLNEQSRRCCKLADKVSPLMRKFVIVTKEGHRDAAIRKATAATIGQVLVAFSGFQFG